MNEFEERSYIGFEYKEVITEGSNAGLYLDGYSNFGWIIDDNLSELNKRGIVRLKRDRKIVNKAELTRLQRHFEDCINQIERLEKSKKSKATAAAIGVGVIGTIFIAGSTFAVVNEPPIIWLCILLAIPGFIGWILPYFIYKKIFLKRRNIVNPLIEEKYDEIYEICKKGNSLLGDKS